MIPIFSDSNVIESRARPGFFYIRPKKCDRNSRPVTSKRKIQIIIKEDIFTPLLLPILFESRLWERLLHNRG